jgi:hypothetical protein
MNRFNAIAITCAAVLVACGGNNSKPSINSFSAIPTAILAGETSALSWDVTGATSLSIDQGVGTVTGTAVPVTPGATKTYTLTATNSAGTATATATVTVSTAVKPQTGFSMSASSSSVAAGTGVTITITAIDTSGATSTSFAGTVHLTSTDSQIAAQDVTFGASDHGVKTATVTPKTAGTVGVFAKDTASQLSGSTQLTVGPASPDHCIASGAPAAARAGDALSVRVTVFDAFGNASTNYTGTVTLTSSDGLASLPAPYTFGAADNGAHDFSVRLGTVGSDSVGSGDGTLSCANLSVTISAGPASKLSLAGTASPVIAGAPQSLTVSAFDAYGNAATDYAGTVLLTSTDAQIGALGVAFGASDQGVKTTTVTPKTAGSTEIFANDSVSQLSASTQFTVGPASPDHFTTSSVPAAARAGEALPVRVAVFDAFGNASTNYTGTITVTTSDPLASLPAPYTFGASDNGAHDFSVRLGTVGSDLVSCGDGTLACSAVSVAISAGPASQLSLVGIASAVIAGTTQSFTVSAFDAYGNPATDYAGPVTLSSTDPAATLTDPGGAFSSGQKSFQVAFGTIGAQTVTATDATGFAGSHGPVGVHGLVYTPAGANGQSVSLNLNATSNAGVVVLDLVATTAITGYSVGMNIPADGSRVGVAGIAKGTALDPGRAPAAMAVALPSAGPLTNVLTSGLSQKLGGSGSVNTDATISGGQVLYTLSLVPTSVSPGVIFDGSQNFRAAIRNLAGDELLSQADFAVGKLELQ